jgi:hypothetical protein
VPLLYRAQRAKWGLAFSLLPGFARRLELHFVHLAMVSTCCVMSVELSNLSNLSNFVELSVRSSAIFSLPAQFRNSPVERATFLRLLTSVF